MRKSSLQIQPKHTETSTKDKAGSPQSTSRESSIPDQLPYMQPAYMEAARFHAFKQEPDDSVQQSKVDYRSCEHQSTPDGRFSVQQSTVDGKSIVQHCTHDGRSCVLQSTVDDRTYELQRTAPVLYQENNNKELHTNNNNKYNNNNVIQMHQLTVQPDRLFVAGCTCLLCLHNNNNINSTSATFVKLCTCLQCRTAQIHPATTPVPCSEYVASAVQVCNTFCTLEFKRPLAAAVACQLCQGVSSAVNSYHHHQTRTSSFVNVKFVCDKCISSKSHCLEQQQENSSLSNSIVHQSGVFEHRPLVSGAYERRVFTTPDSYEQRRLNPVHDTYEQQVTPISSYDQHVTAPRYEKCTTPCSYEQHVSTPSCSYEPRGGGGASFYSTEHSISNSNLVSRIL